MSESKDTEWLEPLLGELLKGLCRAQETPLRFGIDGARLVESSMGVVLSVLGDEQKAALPTWRGLTQSLNGRVEQALGAAPSVPVASQPHPEEASEEDLGDSSTLVDWIEHLFEVTRLVD
ncbi:MAG: hypothetical protein ACYTGQ_10250, partial [Planctomycetota bacterium]